MTTKQQNYAFEFYSVCRQNIFPTLLQFVLCTLHFAPRSAPCTSSLYIPQSTLYTPHCVLYLALRTSSPLHTLHPTLQTLHFTLLTSDLALFTLHSTFDTLRYTLLATFFLPFYTLPIPHLNSTLSSPNSKSSPCAIHTLHLTLRVVYSTVHTLRFRSATHTPQLTHHFTLCA